MQNGRRRRRNHTATDFIFGVISIFSATDWQKEPDGDFQHALLCLYLEVKVSDLLGVQVEDSLQDLLQELRGLLLAQRLLLRQEVEELTTGHAGRRGEERKKREEEGRIKKWDLSDQSQLQIPD